MAKRDPAKTARNKKVKELKLARRGMLKAVLDETGFESEASLNAKIGHVYQAYCDVKCSQYNTYEEFFNRYMAGIRADVLSSPIPDRFEYLPYIVAKKYQDSQHFRDYLDNFLESSFLKHFEEYSKPKPPPDTEYWLGQNHANYGLLITPRYNHALGEWENDKSEIRKVKYSYFTVGHVLASGLCVPSKNSTIRFNSASDYLTFFSDVLVRGTKSEHQQNVADRYINYVNASQDPLRVPLLLPELRYLGKAHNHEYRFDFSVVHPQTFQIVGFELSPWSSHGYLSKTKTKMVKEVNDEALVNFERECEKTRKHFIDRGIPIVTFTDTQLANPDSVFADIKKYLEPSQRQQQLMLMARDILLATDFDAEVIDEGIV